MAITTLAGVEAGLRPPLITTKSSTSNSSASSQWMTPFYQGGYPVAAAVPNIFIGSPPAGVALTSYAGQLPFTNPVSGNTYLASVRRSFSGDQVSGTRTVIVVDRLWHNAGLDRTLITAQAVNSLAWPARDLNGSTDGEGVYLAVEISATINSGGPNLSVSYTNSAGVPSRTGLGILPTRSSPPQGHWFPIGLQEGDTGVQSVQTITLSTTWGTAGSFNLVAYRPVAMVNTASSSEYRVADDALTLAMPQLWNDSVLQVIEMPSSVGSAGGPILVQYTQG